MIDTFDEIIQLAKDWNEEERDTMTDLVAILNEAAARLQDPETTIGGPAFANTFRRAAQEIGKLHAQAEEHIATIDRLRAYGGQQKRENNRLRAALEAALSVKEE